MSPTPPGLYVLEHEAYDQNAPIVVLIHGAMDRSAAFGRVVQRLSDMHVIVYDRRGYGRSAHTAATSAPSLTDHAEDLERILDRRRATLVGHSYGGVVALLVASRRPELVGAVGVFEAPAPWMPWWPADAPGAAAVADGDPGEAAETFIRRQLGDAAWEDLPLPTQADRRAEGAALLADLASLRVAAPFDLTGIGAPALVASGSESPEYHRVAARRMAACLGADLVEIIGGGHGSHNSHPDAFADLARRTVALGR